MNINKIDKLEIYILGGHLINLLKPDEYKDHFLNPAIIANSISKICRFNGQLPEFYSVAEHCVLVSRIANEDSKKMALMHDAAESIVGDMISPIKNIFPDFIEIEIMWLEMLVNLYNIPITEKIGHHVKEIDKELSFIEISHFYKNDPCEDIKCLDHKSAYNLFLCEYEKIFNADI
jgi:hypothetical protein